MAGAGLSSAGQSGGRAGRHDRTAGSRVSGRKADHAAAGRAGHAGTGPPPESVGAFNEAVTAADTLLALADSNIAALQARALALSGLAAAVGDLTLAGQAGEAFGAAVASPMPQA